MPASKPPAPPWPRALVTGAGGFIGSHLVRALRQTGVEVTGVDKWTGAGTDILEVDLARPGSLDALLGPDTAIFHLAGSADVGRSVQEPVADFRDNVATTVEVLESIRRRGAAVFVLPSTGSVYDPSRAGPFNEAAPTRPSSPYGAAKLACEAYCLAYARAYGVDARIARLFSVYGPGMRRFAIYDFYRRLSQSPGELILRGDGGQTRDYLLVEDAVRALVLVAARGKPGEIYNVASGEPRTVLEVARAVAEAMGLAGCQIAADGAALPAELYRMEADVTKLSRIGPLVHTDFRQGLARTIAWFRQAAT